MELKWENLVKNGFVDKFAILILIILGVELSWFFSSYIVTVPWLFGFSVWFVFPILALFTKGKAKKIGFVGCILSIVVSIIRLL